MSKRIMRQFRIDELSFVDRPAVEGARALAIKHRDKWHRYYKTTAEPAPDTRTPPDTPDTSPKEEKDMVERYRARTPPRHAEPTEKQSAEPFMRLVAEYQRDFQTTRTQALTACRTLHKRAFEAFQSTGAVTSHPAVEKLATPAAVLKFRERVDEIAARDKIGKTDAMRRAREEYPQEFAALQRAG